MVTENTDRIFEDKLQREDVDTAEKGLRNRKHRPKAREWKIETCILYWRERDQCVWTGKPTKPGRPDTNTLFSTPDIQRDGLDY